MTATAQVPAGVKPRYCIVSGHLQMPPGNGVHFVSGVLYVGELTTGKVTVYGVPRNLPGVASVREIDSGKRAQKEVAENRKTAPRRAAIRLRDVSSL